MATTSNAAMRKKTPFYVSIFLIRDTSILAARYSRPDCQRQFPINALKIAPLLVNLTSRNAGNTTVVTP